MKKTLLEILIALALCVVLLFVGCTPVDPDEPYIDSDEPYVPPEYASLNDENLLSYVENVIYRDTVASLRSDRYVVERVTAKYISKEYLEEVAYNSQSNIYFGYKLSELENLFQGKKFVFTLGEDKTTTVQEFLEIEDASMETILKNVAIGAGVIIICVVVSYVTAGAGAAAASAIFAASAKTAATFAASSAVFGGISAGVTRGIETGDFEEAMEAAALGASEGFKWGAITGAIAGGGKEAFALKAATKSGLTMNEVARIQMDSNLPMDVISQIHSWDEYLVYKNAGLKTMMINGKTALVPNIDLDYVSELGGQKVTNLVRMQKGYAPIDPATGKAYQLHHIGQKVDGTLAVLTENQHQGNAAILNIFGKESEINRTEFAKIRKAFWQYLGNIIFGNGGV